MSATHSLLAPIQAAERCDCGGVTVEIQPAGAARLKRLIYPAGFRWSTHIKPIVKTELCMHAHVGFLASGHVKIAFPDGCTFDYIAPQFIAIEPGHDGWVVGDEPAVVIEIDFEQETVSRLGMPASHQHRGS